MRVVKIKKGVGGGGSWQEVITYGKYFMQKCPLLLYISILVIVFKTRREAEVICICPSPQPSQTEASEIHSNMWKALLWLIRAES